MADRDTVLAMARDGVTSREVAERFGVRIGTAHAMLVRIAATGALRESKRACFSEHGGRPMVVWRLPEQHA